LTATARLLRRTVVEMARPWRLKQCTDQGVMSQHVSTFLAKSAIHKASLKWWLNRYRSYGVYCVFRPLYIYIYSSTCFFVSLLRKIISHTLLLFILFFKCLPKFSTWIRELIHLAGLGHHGFFPTKPANPTTKVPMVCLCAPCHVPHYRCFNTCGEIGGEDVCGRTSAWVLYVDMALLESNSFWDILKCDTSFAVCIWWFWGCLIYIVRKLMLVSVHFSKHIMFSFVCEAHCIYSVGDGLKAETRKMSTI